MFARRNFTFNIFRHKIKCGPIVEMRGDEMAQVLWDKVKTHVRLLNNT